MHNVRFPTFAAFAVLFGTMYAAFGVASPFWPLFFESRGLSPHQLGLLLAFGTIMRLFVGPLAGRIADMFGALRTVLAVCVGLAVIAALLLLPVYGFLGLLAIAAFQAGALAPITTLADALALNASNRPSARFEYGWVRGIGSGAFVIGTLLAGYVLTLNSLDASVLVLLHAALLSGAIIGAGLVPGISRTETQTKSVSVLSGLREVFETRPFPYIFAISALVLGSHAMHDAFAVIRWNAAGLSPTTVSVLWSEAVAAEVLVFFLLGPWLIERIGPKGAIVIAAVAGGARWIVMSQTTSVAAMALIQPLHGLTFALLHLACMSVIAATIPARLAATAQAIYGFGAAIASAIFTYVSGILFGEFGGAAFLAMSLLCLLAIPLSFALPGRLPIPVPGR
jgi:PPP family 3-phenylpropionic acid transporter